jgi:hypothetical protein
MVKKRVSRGLSAEGDLSPPSLLPSDTALAAGYRLVTATGAGRGPVSSLSSQLVLWGLRAGCQLGQGKGAPAPLTRWWKQIHEGML